MPKGDVLFVIIFINKFILLLICKPNVFQT